MQKPIRQPSTGAFHTEPKGSRGKYLSEDDINYFRHFGNTSTQLNAMVDNAKNYHQALGAIKKHIEQDHILSPKDKKDLLLDIESKLDQKFFPKQYTRYQMRLPAAKK
jgi:RNA binding exosome subunit